jgi:hypothetical protein
MSSRHLKYVLVFMISCSCQWRQHDAGEESITILPKNSSDDTMDTLTVKGDVVVFFEPTREEAVMLMHRANSANVRAHMTELEDSYRSISAQLEHSDVLSFITTARYISVESSEGVFVHDRLSDTSVSGMILSSPGKAAKVIGPPKNDEEYAIEISNYFF